MSLNPVANQEAHKWNIRTAGIATTGLILAKTTLEIAATCGLFDHAPGGGIVKAIAINVPTVTLLSYFAQCSPYARGLVFATTSLASLSAAATVFASNRAKEAQSEVKNETNSGSPVESPSPSQDTPAVKTPTRVLPSRACKTRTNRA